MVDEARNGKILTITESVSVDEPADFDRAISATGYGLFNVLLLLAALPVAWAAAFDTTTGAFILANAECELELTFFRKGVLTALPFIAMLTTSFLWGFVTDHVGKRTLIILAIFLDAFLNISSTAVTSYYVFLLIKFFNGVLVGGPLADVAPFLTEFHSARYKARFARWTGLLFAVGNIVPAVLAFLILPLNWNVNIFNRHYTVWRVYLLICSIPAILGIVTFSVLPESPKHLMAAGKTRLALRLLRLMYRMNTRNPPDTFPIKSLAGGGQKGGPPVADGPGNLGKIRLYWYNARLLLSRPYRPAFGYLATLQFGGMLGFHTMRLWVPHLFIILNNFDWANWKPNGRQPTICEMLDRRAAEPARDYWNCTGFPDMCVNWVIRPVIYQNSTMIATSAVLFGFLAALIIDTRVKKTLVMLASFLISVVSSFGINWAQAPPYMLTLAAAIIVTGRIAGNVVSAVCADVIPIPLRLTSISLLNHIGNFAAVMGNLVFSALLESACVSSYMLMGCLFLVCVCVSCFLPRPVRQSPTNVVQK